MHSIPVPFTRHAHPAEVKEVSGGVAKHVGQVPPLAAVLFGSKDYDQNLIAEERLRMKVVVNASLVAFLGPISTTVYTPGQFF